MGRLGFYFDNEVCTGCRTCQVACKDKNQLEVGTMFRNVVSYETGVYPDAMIYHFSMSCNHCENPACVDACLMRCLDFGDLDELQKKYGGDLVNALPILADPSMTNPSLLIHAKTCAKQETYREVTL